MASFVDDDSPVGVGGGSTHPFEDDYPVASQHFEFSPGFDADSPPVFKAPPQSFGSGDEGLVGSGGFSPEENREYFRASEGPILPPPSVMQTEEGFALREWRRLNAIKLEEKEKREKEMLIQIIEEAEQFKVEFNQKRSVAVEANKNSNRQKEKLFLASRDKFHSEAEKNYWKAIGELIPHEVPTIEKRGKKDKDKKPSIVVIQGPKPGKPTDLSRMRQILLKLKHNTPEHMKPKPPPATEPKKDAKPGEPETGSPDPPPPAATKEVLASA